MNKYNKLSTSSIKLGIIAAVLIIGITVIPFLMGALGSSISFFVFQTYLVILLHCAIGVIYSILKARSDERASYAIAFFTVIITLSAIWFYISFTFLMGDYVFGPMGLITLIPALAGVAIYEIVSLIVSGLKKIIKQESVDEGIKVSSAKSIVVVCILSFLSNISPWLIRERFYIILLGIINILGMALVDTVVNSRKKWIPIIVFICVNAVLIPLNIWLLNVNGIIK